jgi:hypothetical protein
MVILLLIEVDHMVKENPETAVTTILSCNTNTPTSSPCTVRRIHPGALDSEAAKVKSRLPAVISKQALKSSDVLLLA